MAASDLYSYSPRLSDKYTLISIKSDGTMAARAVFNDPNDPDYVGVLTSVSGLEGPEVRESADDLVQADGGVHGAFYYGRRSIVLEGLCYGHATMAVRDARLQKLRAASNAMRYNGLLSWEPITTVSNMIADPGAEVAALNNPGGGTAPEAYGLGVRTVNGVQREYWENFTNSVVTKSTTVAEEGTRSWRFASVAAGTMTIVGSNGDDAHSADVYPTRDLYAGALHGGMGALRVNPGTPYTFTGRARSGGATPRNFQLQISWRNSASAEILLTTGTSTATTNSSWTTVSASATAPAGAVWATRIINVLGATAASELFYFDKGQWTATAAPGVYFDGESAGMFWHGTQFQSPSGDYIPMCSPVRRQSRLSIAGGWNKTFQVPLVSQYAEMFSLRRQIVDGNGLSVGVWNRGDYASWPLIHVRGPLSAGGFTVNDTVNSARNLVFGASTPALPAADEIVINTRARTATYIPYSVNNTNPVPVNWNQYITYTANDFPRADPSTAGSFSLSASGTGAQTSLIVVARDAWL